MRSPPKQRSAARPSVSSIPVAPSGLPASRLAVIRLAESAAPDGGTPTAADPRRPRSCTVANGPGLTTSMRGRGWGPAWAGWWWVGERGPVGGRGWGPAWAGWWWVGERGPVGGRGWGPAWAGWWW